MKSFEGFRKSGTFVVAPGREVQGDLILKGPRTTLDLYANDFFSDGRFPDGCILGTLHDRTKVSLIHCITTQGTGHGFRGHEDYYFCSVFPHLVIFGDEHVAANDKRITNISFHVEDAATLFYDFDAFGQVIDAGPHMAKIFEQRRRHGEEITLGERPRLFYFTGKFEILKAETVFGTVTAKHVPSYASPGPRGIQLENKIHVNLALAEGATVEEAIDTIHILLRFLEIIAGRPQTVLHLAFLIPGPKDKPIILDVYWSMPPSQDTDDEGEREPHPADLPIQAARTPGYFASVLAAWLARDQEWRSARSRFSKAFGLQHRFDIDRLVGAANMFDLLPASALPADVPLTKELQDAKTSHARFSRHCLTVPNETAFWVPSADSENST